MQKAPTEETIAAVLERAKGLPRVTEAELTEEEKMGVGPHGNNFYLLFLAMNRKEEGKGTAFMKIEAVEALGEPWKNFLEKNAPLVEALKAAVREYEIYGDLVQIVIDLSFATDLDQDEKKKRVEGLQHAVDESLGFNAIQIPILRHMNELLRQAERAMINEGIDPFRLTRLESGGN